jgi:hypothetical protein
MAAGGSIYYLLIDGYGGPFSVFINNYALEICYCGTAYFASVLFKKTRGNKIPKVLVIFVFGTLIEVAQYFGFNILGTKFDPIDLAFYAVTLSFAYFLDTQIISRIEGSYEKVEFK